MVDYVRFGTYNAVLPKKGPVAYPFNLDFREKGQQVINMDNEIVAGHIDFISGVYVDNSLNANALDITVQSTNQVVHFPAGKQGYLPLLVTDAAVLTFDTVIDNQLIVPIQVLNFPVWPIIF